LARRPERIAPNVKTPAIGRKQQQRAAKKKKARPLKKVNWSPSKS